MKLLNKASLSQVGLLVATIIWGSAFCVMKDTLNTIPTNFLLAIRFSVAAIILSLVFIRKFRFLNMGYILRGLVLGAFLYIAYAFQTYGLADTTPGKNAFLTAVYCIIVPFLYAALKRRLPDKFSIIASIFCIGGIGFVSLNGNLSISIGDILTLGCGLFYAMHIVAVAKFSKDYDPILLTIFQFFFAGIFGWIGGGFSEKFPTVWSPSVIMSLLYLSIFATAIALLLQNIGQKYTHPATASIILSLESVFGVVFSAIFGYEVLSPKTFLGFVLIFVAIIISETKLSFLRKKVSKQ